LRSLIPRIFRSDILLFDDVVVDVKRRFSFRAMETFDADGRGMEGIAGKEGMEAMLEMEGNESDDTFVDTFAAKALRVKRLALTFGLGGTPAIGVVDADDESTLRPKAFRFLGLRWAKTVLANILLQWGDIRRNE